MPEIPPRKSDRYAKSGEEMMDVLVDDIMRWRTIRTVRIVCVNSSFSGGTEQHSNCSWNGCFDIFPTLCPRTNIEM
jgi:hypothetical protein